MWPANMAKGKRNRKKSSKGPDDGENENGDEGKYNENRVVASSESSFS